MSTHELESHPQLHLAPPHANPAAVDSSSQPMICHDPKLQQKGRHCCCLATEAPASPSPPPPPPSPSSSCNWIPSSLTDDGLLQKMGAELIATYILVFAGCGAVMVDERSGGAVTHIGVSAAFGIVVMIMIYAVGHISGAHMNPAVTLAFATVRHFPWFQVLPYVGAQVAGSILASFSLRLLLGRAARVGATLPAGSASQSLVLEILLSFILMFVVSAVATDTRAIGELAGLAVGSAVGLDAIFGGPISGASMNPARSIGPAVAANDYRALWVYIVGPVLGCLLGAWSYNMIRLPHNTTSSNKNKDRDDDPHHHIQPSRSFKSARHA